MGMACLNVKFPGSPKMRINDVKSLIKIFDDFFIPILLNEINDSLQLNNET